MVPINSPGVTVLCRKISVRDANPFVSALSARNDELDGQMWLDNVFVPNERLFFLDANVDPIARWLFWHQLYCWLSKGEFALGLGLALTDAMGLLQQTPTVEMLLDMITDVQTVRTCITAAELDPSFTAEGYCYPNHVHTSVGSIAMLNARQRLTETLRILPGSSMIVAPTDSDLAYPPKSGLDWRNRSAAEAIRRCNGRHCCRWHGIMSVRHWTGASRCTNCIPTAGSRSGALGCGGALLATTNSPTPC